MREFPEGEGVGRVFEDFFDLSLSWNISGGHGYGDGEGCGDGYGGGVDAGHFYGYDKGSGYRLGEGRVNYKFPYDLIQYWK